MLMETQVSVKVMAVSGNDMSWYETGPHTKAGCLRIRRMVRRQREGVVGWMWI